MTYLDLEGLRSICMPESCPKSMPDERYMQGTRRILEALDGGHLQAASREQLLDAIGWLLPRLAVAEHHAAVMAEQYGNRDSHAKVLQAMANAMASQAEADRRHQREVALKKTAKATEIAKARRVEVRRILAEMPDASNEEVLNALVRDMSVPDEITKSGGLNDVTIKRDREVIEIEDARRAAIAAAIDAVGDEGHEAIFWHVMGQPKGKWSWSVADIQQDIREMT